MKYLSSFIMLLLAVTMVNAQDLMPYTIGASVDLEVKEAQAKVKAAMTDQGLEVVGTYNTVHTEAAVLVFTSTELLQAVSKTGKLTGFAATLRVAITKENGKTVISYTTPEYWGNAYFRDDFDQVSSNYRAVDKKIVAAMNTLGTFSGDTFGSEKGLTAKKLRSYKYMFGMPKFDDTVVLAEFDSASEAVTTIDANAKAGIDGLTQVYKLEIPNTGLTLYGFGMTGEEGEKLFMPKIDIGTHKHTAFLPYEVLVMGEEVHMLHGRYRIALSFPDLTMGTFTKIMSTPGYIEDMMEKVTQKKKEL